MACKDCIHYDICLIRDELSDGESKVVSVLECEHFKGRARFVELPFPISEGTKLYYIFEEIDGKIVVGKDRTTVTRVCKDGFYVSGDLYSDGAYSIDDYFYPWDAIGTEYFFTLEEAEQALKERIENDA